jgi:hypothetical protein
VPPEAIALNAIDLLYCTVHETFWRHDCDFLFYYNEVQLYGEVGSYSLATVRRLRNQEQL